MSALADFVQLLRGRGFRRLTYSRLLSQAGDGMFQAGIAATFFLLGLQLRLGLFQRLGLFLQLLISDS